MTKTKTALAEMPSCVVWENPADPPPGIAATLWCETHDEIFWMGELCPYDRRRAAVGGGVYGAEVEQ